MKAVNFFKLAEEKNGKVFWNNIPIAPLGENRIGNKNVEYNITPDFQK